MTEILLQPTVLFQIADHRRRRFADAQLNKDRVVGCIIGIKQGSRLTINNSFPIPFNENNLAYYVDTEYARTMADMYKKVYGDEQLIGYYTTSPQFKTFDTELAGKMLNLVNQESCLLLNVDCLESNSLEQFYKIYEIQVIDNQTSITPKNSQMHWSLVEKVVLATTQEKRQLVDVVQALSVMENQLITIKDYLQQDDCDLKIVDQIQNLLNLAVDEPITQLIRKSNDNAVKIVIGELVRVCVQMKKNQLGKKID